MKTKKASIQKFKASLWLYPGESANWHFITVPKSISTALKESFGANARGWGSLPVSVTIGKTTWTTSIFPDKKSGTYLLPVKAKVRQAEGLFEGDAAAVTLKIVL